MKSDIIDFAKITGDYGNIRCSFCLSHNIYYGKPLPFQRIFEKTDKYVNAGNSSEAENIFKYYLSVTEKNGDLRGEFTLRNELIGFYRSRNDLDSALKNAERALFLCDEMKVENTVSAATCYVNSAVIFRLTGDNDKALRYFEIARQVYEFDLDENDIRLAYLYNGLALSRFENGETEMAVSLLSSAIGIASGDRSCSEAALSHINLAAVRCENGSLTHPDVGLSVSEAGRLLIEEMDRGAFYDFVFSKYNEILNFTGV